MPAGTETLLSALVYLSEADADAITALAHRFSSLDGKPSRTLSRRSRQSRYGARDSGPLALLSLSASQGVEVTGQYDAIVRIADRIVKAQCSDQWGVGFPVAAPILTACKESTRAAVHNARANTNAAAPARAAWCYGPPGVARALWLAGVASDRSEYSDLAVAAMAAVFERPIPNRRIDASRCATVSPAFSRSRCASRATAQGKIFSIAA